MKRIAFTYGIITGGIIITYTLFTTIYFGNPEKLSSGEFESVEMLGMLRYPVLLIGIFMGMWAYRKTEPENLSYWNICGSGILIAIVIATLVGIMEFSYLHFINPEFFEQYSKAYLAEIRKSGMSEKEITEFQRQMNELSWMRTPVMNGIFYFFETFIIGSIDSMLISIFLKRPTK